MTVQIMDVVTFQGKDHNLLNWTGKGLFRPEQTGIKEYGLHTACWRGFFCGYAVESGRLLLTRANIGLVGEDREAALRGDGPEVYGRKPKPYKDYGYSLPFFWKRSSWWSPDVLYDGLREPIPFTGMMLIGGDPVDGPGLWPFPHYYAMVHELRFEGGELRETYDPSEEMMHIRNRLRENFRRQSEARQGLPHTNKEELPPLDFDLRAAYDACLRGGYWSDRPSEGESPDG